MPCASLKTSWAQDGLDTDCSVSKNYISKYKIFKRSEMLVMSIAAKCFMTRRKESLHTESARLASITAVGIMFYSNLWEFKYGTDLMVDSTKLTLIFVRLTFSLWFCGFAADDDWPRPRFNDCTALN